MCPHFLKDKLFSETLKELTDFSFDEKTVSVFPDMINRSVAGYSLMLSLIGLIASEKVSANSKVYDLGCSLGACSLAVLNSVSHDNYQLTLVDQSNVMIEQCRQLISEFKTPIDICYLHKDVRHVDISNSSMVILNLVLQFLPVRDRMSVISKIYSGLNFGGVLVLSEKVEAEANKSIVDQLHMAFKKRSGYSDLEISQKRQALENVMQTETQKIHIKRLKDAGFSQIIPIMIALNFATILAIK